MGGGPAGLVAANVLAHHGIEHRVFESGTMHPNRGPIDGIGGAGLYSDGKFSFYPSGTRLWSLKPASSVQKSYQFVSDLLARHGARGVPPWSDDWTRHDPTTASDANFKHYPSIYVGLHARIALIEALTTKIDHHLSSRVVSVRQSEPKVSVEYEREGMLFRRDFTHLILASGRLWEADLAHNFPLRFRRFEAGIRIEQPADKFLFRNHVGLDPKYIWRLDTPEREYRTFCVCRNGKLVLADTPIGGLFSGRADGEESDYSNVGLMVRYVHATDTPEWDAPKPFSFPLTQLRTDPTLLYDVLGSTLGRHVLEAIALLERELNTVLESAKIVGPCLEGVGMYPALNPGTLAIEGSNRVLVAGDASGIFRGLIPAMMSGYIAANHIIAGSRT